MRFALLAGAVHGFLAVALGAFGAHGMKRVWAPLADAADRQAWWNTASHYQLTHAIVLVALSAMATQSRATTTASYAIALGTLLFSGTLYLMGFSGTRWLGAITPIGGTLLLVGWGALIWSAVRMR